MWELATIVARDLKVLPRKRNAMLTKQVRKKQNMAMCAVVMTALFMQSFQGVFVHLLKMFGVKSGIRSFMNLFYWCSTDYSYASQDKTQ